MYKKLYSITKILIIIAAASALSSFYVQRKFDIKYKDVKAEYNSTYGIFAILRPDKEGNWYILDDAGHSPAGIISISQFTDRIEVYYESNYKDIYWSSVTPDDSLTLMDIDVGVSVDKDKSKIFLAKSGKLINPNEVTAPSANVWIYINGRG